eukprot:gnl/MRDRNA2_/MRDRNA2_85977_c0_seq1.p1 gnl/MRDRNA2_/MRDRNA2_85977_c0~~gnl/MRDRNA2_/MRDRNA2_85977_c0_seq1.p1  ORF type:complete len:321 (-),score=32.15 gnl/MRDRNA2_/MRDRNA2_85977_c0_seq1:67-1029(-)
MGAIVWPLWMASCPDLMWAVYHNAVVSAEDLIALGLYLTVDFWQGRALSAFGTLTVFAQQVPHFWLRAIVFRIALGSHQACYQNAGTLMTWRYHKLSLLVEHVESMLVGANSIEQFLLALEDFARTATHRWLKVAGGHKGSLLENLVCEHALTDDDVVIECGAFVGYTGARFVNCWLSSHSVHGGGVLVTSLEMDPVHTCTARHLLDLIRISTLIEVWPVRVKDGFPRVSEVHGNFSAAVTFMDQSGATFNADMGCLQRCGLPAGVASVVADNVLRPGAPLYMHSHFAIHAASGCAWALPEFLEEKVGVEDWMAVVRLVK